MNGHWWREQIPEAEEVLWVGKPDQGFFPPRYGWAYKAGIGLIALVWLASPWIFETARDFWKIFACTLGLAFFLWADRFIRAQRVYVVTSHKAWEFNKNLKSKELKVDQFLNFSCHRRRVAFDRHPFFSFDHLSDPDAALQALHQAREAAQ
ncbi:hypothetical protein [uncultured Ruegeria sp.]|uniref:hypothetical protein n=1 Tax=uncultured Ruegeria sp. TaxID=259304 RepID=UPI00260313DB|nr:hypothetical protein [uncultured Ruegeria sp.]